MAFGCCCNCMPSLSCAVIRLQAFCLFGDNGDSSAPGSGFGVTVPSGPSFPFDSGYSFSDFEIASLSAGTAAIPASSCDADTRYYSGSCQQSYTATWSGGSLETRWAKSEWVRDTRDGRLTYYKESNSASGTTYEWSMDDYGVITDSGTQGTNDSILSGRDSCAFPTDEVFNAGVTSTSASFSYQRTCSGNTWENLFEVSIYDAWTDDDCWTQITNLLAYVDLTNHQLVVRTPTAPWSGGPLLASNTSNVPLGDLLTSYCYGTLKVGYVRHETLGVVAVVADQSDTTIIPNSSSFTGTDAAQKYWTTPNAGWSPTSNEANWNYCEYGVTTSDAWMVGCKAAVWSDEAFHLVHTQNKDTACTDDSASGTNTECDWGPANQWVSIQPSDCYYTYGRTDAARDSGSSCSGWDTTGAC